MVSAGDLFAYIRGVRAQQFNTGSEQALPLYAVPLHYEGEPMPPA